VTGKTKKNKKKQKKTKQKKERKKKGEEKKNRRGACSMDCSTGRFVSYDFYL
jgi:hypothetical protein